MRILILTILILVANIAPSMADPITKEMAEQYYNNCVSKQASQKFSKESQEFLCACTASKMMDNMTTDSIRAMSAQDESGRVAMNYMIVKVYAPCMQYPAKDYYYNTCISNPKTKALGKDPKKLCGCMADKVANHLGKNGEKIFEDILTRTPNIVDPMGALEADKEFQNYVGQQVLGCI